MDFIKMFISDYGTTILYAILSGVFAYLGVKVKALADKYLNTKIKQDVARTVVQAVEQVYKDLHGEEKLNQALIAASEMLAEKGITVTDLEMRMLIEAAVAEFNAAFYAGPIEIDTTGIDAAVEKAQANISRSIEESFNNALSASNTEG